MSRRTRENPECSAAMLTALFAAIKHGRRMRPNTESFIRAVELGWFARYQINDLSYDLGLEGFTEELLAAAGVSMATYHYRPRRIDRGAGAFQGLRAADMVRFLIHLERLGFNVDPAPYAPDFSRRYEVTPREAVRREDFKTEAGYKIQAYLIGDEVHFLEVRAPRYRYRPEPKPTMCEACGVVWMKGDPADSARHRARGQDGGKMVTAASSRCARTDVRADIACA